MRMASRFDFVDRSYVTPSTHPMPAQAVSALSPFVGRGFWIGAVLDQELHQFRVARLCSADE